MIRINLLPVQKKVKKSTARQFLALYALCILATVGVIGYFWYAQSAEIARLSRQEARLKKEVQKYAKYERLIKELKKKREIIEKKKEVIQGLQKDRDRMVRALALLSLHSPPDKVWFQQVSIDGGRVNISGIARSNEAIAEFMRNLRSSPYVVEGSVQLSHSRQKVISGRKLREFKLTCSLMTYSQLKAKRIQEKKVQEEKSDAGGLDKKKSQTHS